MSNLPSSTIKNLVKECYSIDFSLEQTVEYFKSQYDVDVSLALVDSYYEEFLNNDCNWY